MSATPHFATLVLLASTLLSVPSEASSQHTSSNLRLDSNQPEVGDSVEIWLESDPAPARVYELHLEYLPGSQLATQDILTTVTADDHIRWSPEFAGLARLEARDPIHHELIARRDVAIRYRSGSPSGLLVLTLAGSILFAGVGIGLRFHLRDPASRGRRKVTDEDSPAILG